MLKPAFILIDMQMGFISPDSSLCIAQAEESIEACSRALGAARELEMPVYHIRREYADDGSDVEAVRFETWLDGGKPLSPCNPDTLLPPEELVVTEGETVIIKPRFSAFFGTNLHETLQETGINTVVLAGTTTPNCIRSTCYDALSLDYNVVIIEDATSSRSAEVQKTNIEDMSFIGAQVISSKEFASQGLTNINDLEVDVSIRRGFADADDAI